MGCAMRQTVTMAIAARRCRRRGRRHRRTGSSGRTPAHAKDGLLNIMTAGDKDAFERVKPVLDDLGENVFHLGPLDRGKRSS